jgi:hypothetical protein
MPCVYVIKFNTRIKHNAELYISLFHFQLSELMYARLRYVYVYVIHSVVCVTTGP